jgi:hypothetical protein
MYDDDITICSNTEQDPEPEQDRWPLLVQFNQTLYRIDNPFPDWSQNSAGAPAECSKCNDTLTFCFAARDPEIIAHAGAYQLPVAVRCNCFTGEPRWEGEPVYHRQVVLQPIPIVFVRSTKS